MIANLEALLALARCGTMSRAAADLRLTQSAVSKRIAALENETRRTLIEQQGRRVVLTEEGWSLVRRAEPLIAGLRDAVAGPDAGPEGRLVIGVAESILASWGAASVAAAARALPRVEVVVNAHRGPVAIDHVRSGEYALAIVAGPSDAAPDLSVETLLEEEMVLVPSRLRRADLARRLRLPAADGLESAGASPRTPVDVLSIETASATWRAVARRLPGFGRASGIELRVAGTVQSYAALVQMARAGFGHALAPVGIVRALGVRPGGMLRFPAPGLTRPVSLVARKTSLLRATASAFRGALVAALPRGAGFSATASR